MLTLPTEKSAPIKKWVRQKFLMIGAGGIGKSELWAQGDKTLFLEMEQRLDHLSVMKVPVRRWADMEQVLDSLAVAVQKGLPYDTIVVDTVDKLVDYIQYEVVSWAQDRYKKIEVNGIGDIPEGVGWFRSTGMMTYVLDKLSNLGCAVVLISHVKSEGDGKEKPVKDTISIGGQMGTKLLYWSDHTLHVRAKLTGDRIDRCVRTLPTANIEAKSSGGIVPDGWMWDKDAKVNYAKLRSLFD